MLRQTKLTIYKSIFYILTILSIAAIYSGMHNTHRPGWTGTDTFISMIIPLIATGLFSWIAINKFNN